MSTFRVTLEQLTIHEHPNADALELAQVGLYRAVVVKGMYQTGDYALYIPEQAILPDPLIEELGLVGRLAGKAKNRVKAIRLRGELSQGIVCRPADAGVDWSTIDTAFADGFWAADLDFAGKLGVTKWVPEIPPQMAGEAVSGADLLRWIDIENLQRYPDIFTPGEPVVCTEKIHGTCLALTFIASDQTVLVSSKGLANNGIALKESDTNLYWRAARAYNLPGHAARLADQFGAARVAIYGEVYGAGVQDLHYGRNARRDDTVGFVVFDIRLDYATGPEWVPACDLHRLAEDIGLPHAPVLYDGPYDLDAIRAAATGATVLGGGAHLREGVVIRPEIETHSPVLGGRKIAKYVSADYLTRGGNPTEYE